MSDSPIREAFLAVRQGRSAEAVVCDPALNDAFLREARRLGLDGDDCDINQALLNLRKRKGLADCPTTVSKKRDPNRSRYLHAVLNAMRFVERQFGQNVDQVICDPHWRVQFDAIVQFLSPGTSPFEAQYAALSLRKSNRLKPEPIGQVIRSVSSKIINLLELEERKEELPARSGVYLFFDEEKTLYAGKADRLRSRITEHVSTWSYRELISSIRAGNRPPVFVVYHELPVTITTRELAAYELELIRSRHPEHNRMGRDKREPSS